jgi:hypothetical protein
MTTEGPHPAPDRAGTHRTADNTDIAVTMTRPAAERLKRALIFASHRIRPDDAPPSTDRERVAQEHADWLSWGVGRVLHAEATTTEDVA